MEEALGSQHAGMTVQSLVDHAHLRAGEFGQIVGPCSDHRLPDRAQRVLVAFHRNTLHINMVLGSHCMLVPIPGG